MAKQFQFRRGSTVAHSTFTGAVGEITVDTDKDTVIVHDGSTEGGFPLLTGIEHWHNVLDYATPGTPIGTAAANDATPAFQAAIDAAVTTQAFSKGGVVVVPHTETGYVVSDLHMRSHIWLLGLGGQVHLANNHITAKATANIVGDAVDSITVTTPGARYQFSPPVTIDGDGTGATATASINAFGNITGIVVDTGGSGYTTATVTMPANNCINLDGDDESGDAIMRFTRIENFFISGNTGNGGEGHGLFYNRHDNNFIANCRIRQHGGDGIHGTKGGSPKSDGLEIRNCWIDVNTGAGLRLTTNSHYCSVTGQSRITNNEAGNLIISCVNFNMFGGVSNVIDGGVGISIANSSAGGLWGVEMEATPSVTTASTMVELGNLLVGRARGFSMHGCTITSSGPTGEVTCIDVNEADNAMITGGFMDGNADGNIIGINVGSGSVDTVIDNPRFSDNIGSGSFTNIVYGTDNVDARLGFQRPKQPAFQAQVDGTQTNIAVGSFVTVAFATENFDRGDIYNTGTNRFTAPVAGLYHLTSTLRVRSVDTAATDYSFRFNIISGGQFTQSFDPSKYSADVGEITIVLTRIMELSANEQVQVEFKQAGGSAQTDIANESTFEVFLIG